MSTPRTTGQQRHMACEFRRLGPAFVSPEWADGDGFEAAVERLTDVIVSDPERWDEVFERAGQKLACREAAVALMKEPFHRSPWGSTQTALVARRFKDALIEAATDVAREELEPSHE